MIFNVTESNTNVFKVTVTSNPAFNVTFSTGVRGPGVAPGGTTGQILAKKTNADFDTNWIDNTGRVFSVFGRTGNVVAESGDYNTSEVTEGSNLYYTNSRVDAEVDTLKGIANGIASLDSNGKVFVAQLPNSVMLYKGAWDASTNTPTLADGIGVNGDVYRTSVEGTQNLGSGPIHFYIGDFAIYNGTIWEKAPAADGVISWNGLVGVVSVTTANLPEGSNLYYTQARFDTAFAAKTTTNLSEGTNLYYTQARFDSAFSAKSTTNLSEGSNLYYLDSRAIAAPLTGYVSGAGTVSSADTILQAFNKLNGNDGLRLLKNGDTITGDIANTSTGYFQLASGTAAQRPGSPSVGMSRYNSNTQRYEFYAAAGWMNHVRLSGDTMTGILTLSADPVNPLDAATRNYVDMAGLGIHLLTEVKAATSQALPAYTYNNGSSGSGATITANANGALTSTYTDGYSPLLNDRIIVQFETSTNAPYNGFYLITQLGDASHPFILTRSTDADTQVKLNEAGAVIDNGTLYGGTGRQQTTANPVVGTDPIAFSKFLSTLISADGNGIVLTGNLLSINLNGSTLSKSASGLKVTDNTFLPLTGGTVSGATTFNSTITSSLGTITTSQPAFSATQTWNNAATTFNGFYLNIVPTAFSNSGNLYSTTSRMFAIELNGTQFFSVVRDPSTLGPALYGASTEQTFNWAVWRNNSSIEIQSRGGNGIQLHGSALQSAQVDIGGSTVGIGRASARQIAFSTALTSSTPSILQLLIDVDGTFSFTDACNFKIGATTGTKIGTSTSQKLGFWNTTPVIQPTNSITAATFVANTSGISNDTATWGGYTAGQVVAALKQIGILA